MVTAPQPLRSMTRSLSLWFATLALLLRLTVPGLHDHHHHHHHVGCDHAHTTTAAGVPGATCPCDHPDLPTPPVAAAAAGECGPCLACAFELANPGGDALRAIAVPNHRAARTTPTRRVRSTRPCPRSQLHSARAPPGPMPERRR